MLKKSSWYLVEMTDKVLIEVVSMLRLPVSSWPNNIAPSVEKAKKDVSAAKLLLSDCLTAASSGWNLSREGK